MKTQGTIITAADVDLFLPIADVGSGEDVTPLVCNLYLELGRREPATKHK